MQFLMNLNIAMRSKLADSNLLMLKRSFFAGCFIATGALLYSLMTSVSGTETFIRLFGALLFTMGLILVYFMKVQLFTGNNLMLASWLDKKISAKEIFRNWFIVYIGNFFGAFFFAVMAFLIFSNIDQVAVRLGAIAELKASYQFGTAFMKALFCNFLVCMAIFLAIVLNTKIKKTIGIIIPITIFVFMGFEHSIANMFFIPVGFLSNGLDFITASTLFVNNIIPVTLGNITGGFIFSLLIFLSRKRSARFRA